MTDDTPTVALERIGGGDLDRIARLGLWLAAAESGSKDPNAMGAAAALRIAYAEHLGLPAHAAGDVHIIQGTLQLSARLKRALAYKHGLRVEVLEETPDSCTAIIVDIRTGERVGQPRTYTLEMAREQNLLNKSTWKQTPDRMLWARASQRVLDDFAPWVTVGVESLADVTAPELDDAGELIPFEDVD